MLEAALAPPEEEAPVRLPSLATLVRYRGRLERDWRRGLEALELLKTVRPPSQFGGMSPGRLRWLAEQVERRAATAGPERADAAAAPIETPTEEIDAPEPCTNEPDAPGPLNRAQRRRLEQAHRIALRRAGTPAVA